MTIIDTPATIPTDPSNMSGATGTHDEFDATAPAATTGRTGFGRSVSAEWFKLRTVRSNLVALGAAAAATIGFGMLFTGLSDRRDGPEFASDGALGLSLGGFQLAQMVIAILGVALVASEYQTGFIRNWFAASPNRVRVLGAKTAVYAATAFVVTAFAATVAFLGGQAVLPDSLTALSLTDDGVVQALAGTAFYGAAIGAIGVGLGFLLRSTAAGAGAVVATLMIAPLLVGLLPSSIGDPIGKILPSNAGTAVQGLGQGGTELLSAGWGVVALLVWVASIGGAAAISLRTRDA